MYVPADDVLSAENLYVVGCCQCRERRQLVSTEKTLQPLNALRSFLVCLER